MLPLPHSDNAWIADLLDGLRRRSRALRRKMHSLECERVFEEAGDVRAERIDLAFLPSRTRAGLVLRAKVWSDRWVWIDAREGGRNGWTMEWTFEGRTAGGVSGRTLMTIIEDTYDALRIVQDKDYTVINKIWASILLRGPKAL